MEKLLNTQMTREAYQAQVYLSYASWAEVNSFAGIASWLYGHMHEEREHMSKIEAIKAAPANPKDIGDCFKNILKHEIENSKEIDKIVNLAHEEKDWATFNFGQWFVEEQIEEETLINGILDKYNLASTEVDGNTSLYALDRDLANAPQEETTPREEEF